MNSVASPKKLTIALAGNPNSGKTTIFNNLTGTRQKVGNWPGVTVEKKEGHLRRAGYELKIIDLPGTYSLTPFSVEEIVARDFVLEEAPDVVIDIIDASNLERSLYLATQLRELDCKVLFALNMADLARGRGLRIDDAKLSELLDVPVVFTVGNRNEGLDNLLKRAIELAESAGSIPAARKVRYNKDIEAAIGLLRRAMSERLGDSFAYDIRWTAIKLLENDQIVQSRLRQKAASHADELLDTARKLRLELGQRFNDDLEIVMTEERYGFIAGIIKEVLTASRRRRADISRTIDLVLTNRFLGFPIFIFFIWAMFQMTFTLGAYPMGWIEHGVALLSTAVAGWLPESWFRGLLVEGVIAGIGSVIVFLPNILILFFCIALFEDTGYMSRAAFLMDKIMHLIGLHGKSFIPMLMGFGCSVPAVMAARTLESQKDRILTILITPFMSCSAKLPVYIVLAGTFFGAKAGNVIFGVYLAGIVLAVITGRLLRSTLLRGADAPFVMELPPYRAPMFKSLIIHMWDRGKIFLRKMGGIILIGSVVVWCLSAFPRAPHPGAGDFQALQESDAPAIVSREIAGGAASEAAAARKLRLAKMERSFMGRIGHLLEPVFAPIGVDWRGGVALLSGFVAKEIVVSTLGVLHAVDDPEASDALGRALKRAGMTPLSALAMLFFVLLYLPCLATVAAIRRETGSTRWLIFSVVFNTSVAWLAAFAIYQGGRLLGYQ